MCINVCENEYTVKKEALLLAISQAIRDALSNMTNGQLEKLMKSPLEDFRQSRM